MADTQEPVAGSLLNAAAELKRFSQQLRGILALGDVLEQWGSLEQAITEAQSRLSALQAQEEQVHTAKREAERKREAAELAARLTKDAAQKDADQRNRVAYQSAAQLIADAQASAASIIEKAQAEAEGINKQARIAGAASEALDQQIAAREAYASQIEAHIALMKQRVAEA